MLSSYPGCLHGRGLSCLLLKPLALSAFQEAKNFPCHVHLVANKNLIHS